VRLAETSQEKAKAVPPREPRDIGADVLLGHVFNVLQRVAALEAALDLRADDQAEGLLARVRGLRARVVQLGGRVGL
jgi:hypothetical protein